MRTVAVIEPSWEGRYLMLRELEGWYAVAVYSARRQVPVLFSEDFYEVHEEIQYRSGLAAAEYLPEREYIYVGPKFGKVVREFGAEYDEGARSWYVPDDLHNLVGTALDKWRNPERLEFLTKRSTTACAGRHPQAGSISRFLSPTRNRCSIEARSTTLAKRRGTSTAGRLPCALRNGCRTTLRWTSRLKRS